MRQDFSPDTERRTPSEAQSPGRAGNAAKGPWARVFARLCQARCWTREQLSANRSLQVPRQPAHNVLACRATNLRCRMFWATVPGQLLPQDEAAVESREIGCSLLHTHRWTIKWVKLPLEEHGQDADDARSRDCPPWNQRKPGDFLAGIRRAWRGFRGTRPVRGLDAMASRMRQIPARG